METFLGVSVSLLAGAGLGYIFFWGLWQTVNRIPSVDKPYLWMFSSFLIRTAIVILGFYLLLQYQWQFVAVALIGFVAIRMILLRRYGSLTDVNSKTKG